MTNSLPWEDDANLVLERQSFLSNHEKKLNIEDEPFVWQETRIAGVQVKGLLDGNIYAETIVLAGGAWNNVLLEPIGLDGHVKSKKRQIFQINTSTK